MESSPQTAVLARSTAGVERSDWVAATHWLGRVERDARDAEREAELAARLAIGGQCDIAVTHVRRACCLESLYKTGLVWSPLREAISEQIAESESFCLPEIKCDSRLRSKCFLTSQVLADEVGAASIDFGPFAAVAALVAVVVATCFPREIGLILLSFANTI